MAPKYKETFHKNLSLDGLPEVACLPLQYILDRQVEYVMLTGS